MPRGKGTYGSKVGRPKKARTSKTNLRTQKPQTPKTMEYRKSRKR